MTETPEVTQPDGEFRSGFVSIVGLPNVGKSTLVNQFLERAACITSFKPQTTRHHLRCVATSSGRQIILVDTPGFITSQKTMDRLMRKEIYRGLDGVDVVVYVVDAARLQLEANRECWKALATHSQAKRLLVLNKIDQFAKVELIPLLERLHRAFEPDELVPVSALKRTNLAELDRVLTGLLPLGPKYYPDDTVIDRPIEFVVAELVREQLYVVTRQELPFSTAVVVDALEVDERPVSAEDPGRSGDAPESAAGGRRGARAARLACSILVEKDSQKGIIIGANGSMIRDVRERATRRISEYLGTRRVKVELTVRVKRNWRQDLAVLRSLGYE